MRRYGWNLWTNLWFVFLIALGLKAAHGTWDNLKRGSIMYHRQLADQCKWLSISDQRIAAKLEDESSSQSISDPAMSAFLRKSAMWTAWSARTHSLLEVSLTERAELCEKSRLGWIFLQYETSRNPPSLPVHHSTGNEHRPWFMNDTLAAFFRHPIMAAFARVDFFWLACLVLAILGKKRSTRAKVILGVRSTWCHIRFWLMMRIW